MDTEKKSNDVLPGGTEGWKQVLENARECVFALDTEGRLIYGNKASGFLLDVKPEDFVGRRFEEVGWLDRDQLLVAVDGFRRVLQGEVPEPVPYTLRRPDGETKNVEISSYLAEVDGKKIVLGILRDVTDRVSAEIASKESEQKFELLFRVNPIITAVSTLEEGRFIEVNEAFVKAFGDTRENIIGRTSEELGIFIDYEKRAETIEEMSKTGSVSGVEVNVKFRDEKPRKGLFSVASIDHGGRKFLLTVMVDITEQLAERERSRKLDDLKNAFIRVVTDHVQAPLNSIRWGLKLLMNGELGDLTQTQKKYLKTIHDAESDILARVKELQTVLDIEEGRVVINKETVSLTSLCAAVVSGMTRQADLDRVHVEFKKPDDELFVEADADKIQEAMTILTDNALDYTAADGRIGVALERRDGHVRFSVADTGIGIPDHDKDRVFSRFFRASNASTMKSDATGLGLTAAKYYVEQHGGEIGFESKEGEGSTFWFQLPVTEDHEA